MQQDGSERAAMKCSLGVKTDAQDTDEDPDPVACFRDEVEPFRPVAADGRR